MLLYIFNLGKFNPTDLEELETQIAPVITEKEEW